MTPLQRHALGILPLNEADVEKIYDGLLGTPAGCLRSLCASHERLRAELQGAENLWQEAEAKIEKLKKYRDFVKTLLGKHYTIGQFLAAVDNIIGKEPV